MGPHGRAVRLRASGRFAGYCLLFKRSHGWIASARGNALPRGHLRRTLFERSYAHLLSFEFLYSESGGVRGCKSEPGSLARSGNPPARSFPGFDAGTADRTIPRRRALRKRPSDRHHHGTLKAQDRGYLAGIGPRLQAFFNSRDLLLRPLGNTIYVMPPYCATAVDLNEIYAAIKDAADALA